MTRLDEQRFLSLIEQMVRSVVQESEARLESRLQQLEERLTVRLDSLETKVDAVSARVDLIKEAVDSLEEGMTDVRKVLVYLQDKWVEHDREIWQIKRKA